MRRAIGAWATSAILALSAPAAASAGSQTHYFYDIYGRYTGLTTTGVQVRSNRYDPGDNRQFYQLLIPNRTVAPNEHGLASNEAMFQGQIVTSPGGVYTLSFQEDGNVVLYHGSSGLFSTSTNNRPSGTLLMQADGNLCVYDAQWQLLWQTNTAGNAGAFLNIQDDGNMVVRASNGTALWASNTAGQ